MLMLIQKSGGIALCAHPILTQSFLSNVVADRLKSTNSSFLCSPSRCVCLNSHWVVIWCHPTRTPISLSWCDRHCYLRHATWSIWLTLNNKCIKTKVISKDHLLTASGKPAKMILMPNLQSCMIWPGLFLPATELGEAGVCGRRL